MGRDDYVFAIGALRWSGYSRALKVAISGLCLSMAVLGFVVEFHPLGPATPFTMLVHRFVVASTVVVGIAWLLAPMPGYRMAVAFVVWADVSIGVAATVLSAPEARLCATIHMGLIGVFAAFLLGAGILMAHCVFSTVLIVGLTAWAVVVEGYGLFDLFIFYAPALSTVVLLPLLIQAVIDGGRRAIGRVTDSAGRDPLTGLRNRRALHAEADTLLRGARQGSVVVAAVCDIDEFKSLNDEFGHAFGDETLLAAARRMTSSVRRGHDIVARLGGDELAVIALLDDATGFPNLVDWLTSLAAFRHEGVPVTMSIGVAARWSSQNPLFLDDLLSQADREMYRVKRAGGGGCSVDVQLENGVPPT